MAAQIAALRVLPESRPPRFSKSPARTGRFSWRRLADPTARPATRSELGPCQRQALPSTADTSSSALRQLTSEPAIAETRAMRAPVAWPFVLRHMAVDAAVGHQFDRVFGQQQVESAPRCCAPRCPRPAACRTALLQFARWRPSPPGSSAAALPPHGCGSRCWRRFAGGHPLHQAVNHVGRQWRAGRRAHPASGA